MPSASAFVIFFHACNTLALRDRIYLRVLKTVRQTSLDSGDEDSSKFSYIEAATDIIDSEGWAGLLGRGLETRLLANAVQGALFSVLFKFFQGSSR